MEYPVILHLSKESHTSFEKVMDIIQNQLGEDITIGRKTSMVQFDYGIATLKLRDGLEIREAEKMIRDLCSESQIRLTFDDPTSEYLNKFCLHFRTLLQ